MTSTTRIQLRGDCQCCGRDQAVLQPSGKMSKHGYEVSEYHYFHGVCQGERYLPIQVERTQADAVIVAVRADVVDKLQKLELLRAGKIKPTEAKSGRRIPGARNRMVDEKVPFADAPAHYQTQAIAALDHQFESQARHGARWADDFELLVNLKHGEKLDEVEIVAPPARIQAGEQRTIKNGNDFVNVLTASYQDGANVRYSYTRSNGQKFNASMGVQAWRRLPLAV